MTRLAAGGKEVSTPFWSLFVRVLSGFCSTDRWQLRRSKDECRTSSIDRLFVPALSFFGRRRTCLVRSVPTRGANRQHPEFSDEAHLSTQCSSSCQEARFPCPDGHRFGAGDLEVTPCPRPNQSFCLTVRHGSSVRARSPLPDDFSFGSCRFGPLSSRPLVVDARSGGFCDGAWPRNFGSIGSVRRNRARRG